MLPPAAAGEGVAVRLDSQPTAEIKEKSVAH